MPNVISLFAGCGGSSLGYRLAGCRVMAAIEKDPLAALIYRENGPETLILEQDIALLDPERLMLDLDIEPGMLDILDGSPPCQGFSMAGKRLVQDPRNRLFQEYLRFLTVIRPKAFVMENVSGLVSGKMRPVFSKIVRLLSEAGYTVRARILDAAYYGVPQHRRRLIVLGIRNDLGLEPRHPKPFTFPISFREASQGLSGSGLIQIPQGKALAITRTLKPGESGRHLHTRYGHKANDYSLVRLYWDKPSPTVCRTIRLGQCGLLHPEEDRFLGIQEIKRVCSFPEEFQLDGSFEQQWGLLGNAVPPLLMKAIAEKLLHQLGGP